MAKKSLAVEYRPKSFDDLTEQESIVDILENQVNTKTFQHAYLFTGPAGTGKTTSARIFGSMLNGGKGSLIEIDAASNSGVDNIRQVIEDASRKPLDCDYKIFIIDECHSLSSGAWQAMLKLLEEPPAFSVFVLCTTDPQKIPATILSRVQRFQFNKISNDGIYDRLVKICKCENINVVEDSLRYITTLANGGMRDAISLLDKCISYNKELSIDNVLKAVGAEDYDTFFKFLELLCDKNVDCIQIIDSVYEQGKDVKQFIKEFNKLLLDVLKFQLFGHSEFIALPRKYLSVAQEVKVPTGVLNTMVQLGNKIKWESDAKTIIELDLLVLCKVNK